ncbi:hypothetical protein UR09_05700 [Candidatus Nitromaritima sp. SCGC AAA799-A02]|nr:hypothetical protein UZ36_07665 [Candidatus Nitromaritima sp. SCGC AAA799-C22]KMP10626.1 hypothetical protein UR09_05700 [Candidatus Nitromaritima sp. SCGC AAA799-A02]
MKDTTPREIECVLCQESYTPLLGPEEGEKSYRIYCSSCVNWVAVGRANPLRIALREVLGIRGEALALAVQTCLAPCRCGAGFSHDAGKRCPLCIEKIESETREEPLDSKDFKSPWNPDEMKKLEPKFFEYILGKTDQGGTNLNQLIEKFETGEIDAEEYMEGVESIQFRESNQIAVVEAWAMTLDPDQVFAAVEEHDLVERYGTRVLVSIASALESNTGRPVLATLNKEMKQFDEVVQKELKTFIAKIGGGF